MKVLGISADEQKALWFILGAIYHLGAAGATKGVCVRERVNEFKSAFEFSPDTVHLQTYYQTNTHTGLSNND